MKKIIKSIFGFFNIAVRSKSKLEKKLSNSVSKERWEHDIEFSLQIGTHIGADFLKLIQLSKSQFRQDLFALKELKLKKNGFFCRIWCNRWCLWIKYFFIGKRVWLYRNSC